MVGDLEGFLARMRDYRQGLPEDEQRLLDSMLFAALGQPEGHDEDLQAYWYTYPYLGWYGSPWAYAYRQYYSRYW
jgi:hypothetical protein